MLTKKQNKMLDGLGEGTTHGAPHLTELAECLSDAFGGPRALAETLHGLVNDSKTPDWLKMRAHGIVVNTIAGASKLADTTAVADVSLLSDDDLRQEAACVLRESLGISNALDPDLAVVVAAWPELSAESRANILAAVGDVLARVQGCSPATDPQERENDLQTTDSI